MSEDKTHSIGYSPEAFSEERKLVETISQGVASVLHDAWRETRRIPDTNQFEPRLKNTKDQSWIEEHGTNEVDIANTRFSDLPADWQAENLAAARGVVNTVTKAINHRGPLTPEIVSDWMRSLGNAREFRVYAGVDVHDQWLDRNRSWAPAEQQKPFYDLSPDEQEKDSVIVDQAVKTADELTQKK